MHRKFTQNRNIRFPRFARKRLRTRAKAAVSPCTPSEIWGRKFCFGRIIRSTGISGPLFLQRAEFLEGYKYPSSYLQLRSSPRFLSPPLLQAHFFDISQSLHPNSLIFGGLKEKARIYIFTKQFFISPSFTGGTIC